MFRVFKLGLIFPVVLLSGCVLTTEMWETDFGRSAWFPTVDGVARTNDTNSLIVSYSLPHGMFSADARKYYVVLPLDDGFHVPYPYENLGTNRLQTHSATRQIEQLHRVHLQVLGPAAGRKLVERGSFVAANTSSNGVRTPIGRNIGYDGMAELDYWTRGRGKESEVSAADNIKFTDVSHIVLLPSSVPRPGGEYTASAAGGLVKTPFYLVADVFFDPFLAFEFVFVGLHVEKPPPTLSPTNHQSGFKKSVAVGLP